MHDETAGEVTIQPKIKRDNGCLNLPFVHLGLTVLRLRDMLDLAYHGISWRSRQSP